MFIGSLLMAAAFTSANGDIQLTQRSISQTKAYAAAVAGIDVYKYQLETNPNYWTTCPGPTAKVAGTTDETYTLKTLPSTGHATCESGKQASIIETAGSSNGTFRIQSTGASGPTSREEKRSVVAQFTHPGFLDYVFLSNFEVEDPSTFEPEPAECNHYYEERVAKGITNKCPPIPFIGEDELNGPFHTNDAAAICSEAVGAPTFGRTAADPVEMNQGHYTDPTHFGCGGSLTLKGKYTEETPTLLPPETNTELLEAAEFKPKGRTVIELNGATTPNKMTVTTYNFVAKKFETAAPKNFPANGVVYVENQEACPYKYSPFSFDKNYEKDTENPVCGNVYVKGSYTESLTVASAGDVIIIGSLTTTSEASGKPTGGATLGLIANDFVRVYHPVKCSGSCKNERSGEKCEGTNETALSDSRKWGSLENIVVDAAILSTRHSWIVDNFLCGNSMGTLTVWGAIAQDWRGRVRGASKAFGGGFTGGYVKVYNYDERLRSQQPPNFLSPTATSGWKVTRETAPANGCC
jgi:hypothetical protein